MAHCEPRPARPPEPAPPRRFRGRRRGAGRSHGTAGALDPLGHVRGPRRYRRVYAERRRARSERRPPGNGHWARWGLGRRHRPALWSLVPFTGHRSPLAWIRRRSTDGTGRRVARAPVIYIYATRRASYIRRTDRPTRMRIPRCGSTSAASAIAAARIPPARRSTRPARPRAAATAEDAVPAPPAPARSPRRDPRPGRPRPGRRGRAPRRVNRRPLAPKSASHASAAFLSLDVTHAPEVRHAGRHGRRGRTPGACGRASVATRCMHRRRPAAGQHVHQRPRRERHTEPAPKLSVVCARETAVHHERGARRGCTRRY